MFRKAALDAGVAASASSSLGSIPRRIFDTATLKLHALAVRLDEVPQEFGDAEPVDTSNPTALRREWLRQLKMWASYNPEDVFALKAGAVAGVVVLAGVLVVVAAV